jgi:hypothetical protein
MIHMIHSWMFRGFLAWLVCLCFLFWFDLFLHSVSQAFHHLDPSIQPFLALVIFLQSLTFLPGTSFEQ